MAIPGSPSQEITDFHLHIRSVHPHQFIEIEYPSAKNPLALEDAGFRPIDSILWMKHR